MKKNLLVAKEMTKDNPDQQVRIDKILTLVEGVDLPKAREVITEAKNVENGFLNQRNATAIHEAKLFNQKLAAASILGGLLFLLTLFIINYHFYKRQKIQKRLQQSEAYKSAILDSASDGILTMTEAGIILSVNPQTAKIFKYPLENLLNKGIDILIHGFSNKFSELINHESQEMIGMTKDGSQIYVEVSIAPLTMQAQHLYVIVIRDISEKVKHREMIRAQQAAIRELSTPVLQLAPGLLILPIIGEIDSHRASQITEQLLHGIREKRGKVVVMDITGVLVVDSRVANHLIQTIDAARLMGALVVISGLSAEVANTVVTLGIDLTKITTVGDLESGIEIAQEILKTKHMWLTEALTAEAE